MLHFFKTLLVTVDVSLTNIAQSFLFISGNKKTALILGEESLVFLIYIPILSGMFPHVEHLAKFAIFLLIIARK